LFAGTGGRQFIIEPGEYRSADKPVKKGPYQPDYAAQGTYVKPAVQMAEERHLSCRALEHHYPPRQSEYPDAPHQPARQRKRLDVQFHNYPFRKNAPVIFSLLRIIIAFQRFFNRPAHFDKQAGPNVIGLLY
jgi:hypothetical protein